MPDSEKLDAEKFTLTDEAFKAYVRNQHKFTIEAITGDHLMPHLLVITRNIEGEDELVICALAVPFNEKEEKHHALFHIGKKFFQEQKVVLAVVLSSEAWISKRHVDGDWQNVQPRHDPHRTEVILVAGAAMDPKQRMIINTPVKRDEKNNIVIDGEPEEMMGAEFFLISHFWRGYLDKFTSPPSS